MAFPVAKLFLEPGKAVFYLYCYARYHALVLRRGRRFIRFRGKLPTRAYSMWKVCRLLGIAPSLTRGAPAIQHIDATWCGPPSADEINGRCCDVSKTTIARAFESAFGYPLLIADPRTHAGTLIAKSEHNARHDGVVLQGPVATPRDDLCYQRDLDNRIEAGVRADLRTAVVGDEVVQVVIKARPDRPETRFFPARDVVRVEPLDVDEMFSAEEQRCILAFSRAIGLDFGELDILRDRADGRIYIVDAAHTPQAPSDKLTLRQRIAVMHRIAASFERQFCRPASSTCAATRPAAAPAPSTPPGAPARPARPSGRA